MTRRYTLEVKDITIERTQIKQRLYVLIGLDGNPVKILDAVTDDPMQPIMMKHLYNNILDWCNNYVRNLNQKLISQSRNL